LQFLLNDGIKQTTCMKILACIALLATQLAAFSTVTLSPGNSYVFDFTLSYAGPAHNDIPTVTLGFAGGNPGQNWTAEIEFFSNSTSESPFYTDTYTHIGPVPPFEDVGRGYSFDPSSPPPWPDLQGVVRVTSLSGKFELDSLVAHEDVGGGFYYSVFDAVVPEPSAAGLLAMGTGVLLVARRRAGLRARPAGSRMV